MQMRSYSLHHETVVIGDADADTDADAGDAEDDGADTTEDVIIIIRAILYCVALLPCFTTRIRFLVFIGGG